MSHNPPSGAAPAPSGPKPPPKPAPKVKYNPLIQRKKPLANAKPPVATVRKPAAPAAAATPAADASEDGEYEDIPIYTTKRALMEGKRHHVLKFAPKFSAAIQKLDPADQGQFTRPVNLHRHGTDWTEEDALKANGVADQDTESKANPIDEKEKARLAQIKADKEKTREENMKQVAPVANTQKTQKQPKFKKNTEQVYKFTDLAVKQKNMEIRYEEKLPWHVEDFEYQQVWQGNYESALSGNFVVFVPGQKPVEGSADGKTENVLRMIPLEKWYKFSRINHYKALSWTEANAAMNTKYRDPAFLARAKAEAAAEKAKEANAKANSKLFTRKGERGETTRVKTEDDFEGPEIAEDVDDIDFNYEEDFADDEENDIFGTDDKDEKDEAVNKIKRDQRQANVFELREERDYDKEEEEEEEQREKRKKQSRKVQKALMTRERNLAYEDSDDSLFDSTVSESPSNLASREYLLTIVAG